MHVVKSFNVFAFVFPEMKLIYELKKLFNG